MISSTSHAEAFPVVRRLPPKFSISEVFPAFASRTGCLWFDSVPSTDLSLASGLSGDSSLPLARYSFLMSDPIDTLIAHCGANDPWPVLNRWVSRLPLMPRHDLPPMQGGIAGLIGYEAATWLESVGLSPNEDFPTPAMSLGLYDWTIATDHAQKNSWLISQGFTANNEPKDSPSEREHRAIRRADEIETIIERAMRVAHSKRESDAVDFEGPSESVTSNFSSEQFRICVSTIIDRIRAGDFFQANLAQRLLHPETLPPPKLYQRLRAANPAPYSVFYHGDGFDVLSSSPEAFLKLSDGTVETRPIKGTVPRTGDVANDQILANGLLQSKKDRAENIMIVDLMRNDLSRVCTDDSVRVRKLCQIERYQFVQHLVSIVVGKLRNDQNVVDLLKACFPGGSVTGAPKIEAMRTIAELEPHRRGPYCGSMGYISCTGDAEFNILIRTITSTGGYWQIPVGGGITARSVPEAEETETWTKAKGLLRALPK
ncbi:Aminodeoxychorismate synthase component 1 [Planctomycetes bacterium CA13]|uniref:Aminodeoxychorismate synthase component 1 n=1 Tax=Novipirellula herctigrandis TaxID=2527986 RepID=A0A5C5YNK4_9BACT|nr:Aminodeoxychorismate synthase component 1 [Planctomycetes bacterium CA13]